MEPLSLTTSKRLDEAKACGCGRASDATGPAPLLDEQRVRAPPSHTRPACRSFGPPVRQRSPERIVHQKGQSQ